MKIIIISVILCLFSNTVIGQSNPGGVSGYTLWLRAEEFYSDALTDKTDDPEAIKSAYFNYNPVLDVLKSDKVIYENTLKERYTLFAVFKSDSENEKPIIALRRGKSITYLTNKALLSENEFLYNNINSKEGIIVTFSSTSDGKRKVKNHIELEDFYNGDEEGKEQLIEVICYDRVLNLLERQKVETYLSLKYGLSLIGEADYINSEGEKIWTYKDNKLYSNRLTGIGRDDVMNLYQKQSGNSQKDGLYIGLGKIDTTNAKNRSEIQDKTFLLWGDNKGSALLKRDKSAGLQKMKRFWKMRLWAKDLPDSLSTQVRIDKSDIGYSGKGSESKDEFVWLVLSPDADNFDYATANYYRQSSENKEFVHFDNIVWDGDKSGSDLFTFTKGPDFFFEADTEISCGFDGAGTISTKIIGGAPPYTIEIGSQSFNDKISITTDNYQFSHLTKGDYNIVITDSAGRYYTQILKLNPSFDINGSLASVWRIENDTVNVRPEVPTGSDLLSYEWKKEGKLVFSDKVFIAKEVGEYVLTLFNEDGCSKEFPFIVEKDLTPGSNWKLYPNPVPSTEDFTLQFILAKESLVNVRVNSIEGKLISDTNLGNIQNFEYTSFISTSGIYIITVTIDNVPEAVSLIVK